MAKAMALGRMNRIPSLGQLQIAVHQKKEI